MNFRVGKQGRKKEEGMVRIEEGQETYALRPRDKLNLSCKTTPVEFAFERLNNILFFWSRNLDLKLESLVILLCDQTR